jgi:hypothetical protein
MFADARPPVDTGIGPRLIFAVDATASRERPGPPPARSRMPDQCPRAAGRRARSVRGTGVGPDAECGVIVEAAPSSPFEMPEPDHRLQLLMIALDAPA